MIIRKPKISDCGINEFKRVKKTKTPFYILSLMLIFLTVSCGLKEPPAPIVHEKDFPYKKQIVKPLEPIKPTMLLPLFDLKPRLAIEEKMPYESNLFSFSARNTPLQDVLLGIAKQADLNLVMEKGVNSLEPVSVEFKNLPLRTVLRTLLSSREYFYDIESNVLKVKAFETRFFNFNYPLVYNVPTSEVGGEVLGGGDGGGNDLTGEFTIETGIDEEHLNVWNQIEKALLPQEDDEHGGLLSEQGKALINRMSGIIVVTDRLANVTAAEKFLSRLEKALRRQVVIEAKIVEVVLNYEHQFGINWNAIQQTSKSVFTAVANLSNISAIGTGVANVGYVRQSGEWGFESFIDALSTQGNVNVISSPRLNVLNNQSALITVGTTIPYLDFEMESTTNATTNLPVTTAVPTVKKAQEGITLGITPQISENNLITLHIVPIITKNVGTAELIYENNAFNVPIMDISQTDTIVMAGDGETVVIGGLIKDYTTDSVSKVPILGDIPVFGKLFSTQRRVNKKSELVLLLTPTIVKR